MVSPLARSGLSDEFWRLSLDSPHATDHARAPPASISSLEAIARGRVRSEGGGIFEGESGFKGIERLRYLHLNIRIFKQCNRYFILPPGRFSLARPTILNMRKLTI